MRLLTQIAATILIIVGAILFPLPVPIGIVFLAVGFAMLIVSSRTLRNSIRKFRKRNDGLNGLMNRAEQLAPKVIGGILRKTNPDHHSTSTSNTKPAA